jgi:hypothetical protein
LASLNLLERKRLQHADLPTVGGATGGRRFSRKPNAVGSATDAGPITRYKSM